MEDLLKTSYTNPFNSVKDFNTDEDGDVLLNQTYNSSAPDGGNFKILVYNPESKRFALFTKMGNVNMEFHTSEYNNAIKKYNNFDLNIK